MTNEERYKEALIVVINNIRGDGLVDMFKPLSAGLANQIAEMCQFVLAGDTTKDAIDKIKK